MLAPTGPVYQAGTLSGNPLATAAGLAVLNGVTPADHEALAARAQRFGRALCEALRAGGLWACVPAAGPLLGLYVAPAGTDASAPSNYPEARAIAELGVYPHLFHALLRRGVAMAPGAYEILFLSMAHTDAMLEEIVELAGEAATEVAASLR